MIRFCNLLTTTIVTICAGIICPGAAAQPSPPQYEFVPPHPSSAETVYLKIPRTCATQDFSVEPSLVSSSNGRIYVILISTYQGTCGANPNTDPIIVDLGRLPPGRHLVDVDVVSVGPPLIEGIVAKYLTAIPLDITTGRAAKVLPFVRINYSDHWWDPNDPGWGLFIWHDARDQVLAAWFTYGADGKPAWYTIQGGSWINYATYEGKLVKASRAPSGVIASPGPASAAIAGTATLDFRGADGINTGKFIYSVEGGTTQTRNIRRFSP